MAEGQAAQRPGGEGAAPRWEREVDRAVRAGGLERAAEAEGFATWRLSDFAGRYHLHRIKNAFPIVGSAIALERVRIAGQQRRGEQAARREAEAAEALEARVQEKGKLAEATAELRAKFANRHVVGDGVAKALAEREATLKRIAKRHAREKAGFGASCSPHLVELVEACRRGNVRRVREMLLDGEVHPDETGAFNNGQTAVMEACKHGHVTTVHALLDLGADPSQKDLSGQGSLHVMWRPYLELEVHQSLEREAALRNVELMLEHLMRAGVDLSMRDLQGTSALHLAARAGHTRMCMAILRDGGDTLLHLPDADGRKPLDVVRDSKSECARLLRNWEAAMRGAKLAEFQQEWSRYLEAPHPGNRLVTGPSANKVLFDLKMGEWAHIASAQIEQARLGRLARDAVEQGRRGNLASQGLQSEGDDPAAKSVSEFVRHARLRYTSTYRARVERDRQRLKPSDRKLTLIEYLVGAEGRRQAAEQDQLRKQHGPRKSLAVRRKTAALKLAEAAGDGAVPRPRTALGTASEGPLAVVAAQGRNLPHLSNTLTTVAQRAARRRACVPSAESRAGDLGVVERPAESTLSRTGTSTSSLLSLGKDVPRYLKRQTIQAIDVDRRPERRRVAYNKSKDSSAAPSTPSTATEHEDTRSASAIPGRRRALAVHSDEARRALQSIQAFKVEADYVRDVDKQSKRRLNPVALMPPKHDPREHASALKLEQGAKQRYSKIDLADALAVLGRLVDIPKPLRDAIVRSVDLDDHTSRGAISMQELRDRFRTFRHNNVDIPTEQALGALERCLVAKHRFDTLSTTLSDFANTGFSHGAPRKTALEERPVTSEPWLTADPCFSNAELPCHDENPTHLLRCPWVPARGAPGARGTG